MAKLDKIVAFVATRNAAKAKEFYRGKLGLKFISDDGFALVFDIGGTMFRIATVKDPVIAPYTVLGWEVQNIARAVSDLAKEGVVFEHFPGLQQDKAGIWTAPSNDKVAWFKDPDGNLLSLSEHPGRKR
ncbi:MAG TPA: VOC family protein [Candidatus Angelobacter sp.]|nr:VOC family protein [Candidatus Angelobacter sp.]